MHRVLAGQLCGGSRFHRVHALRRRKRGGYYGRIRVCPLPTGSARGKSRADPVQCVSARIVFRGVWRVDVHGMRRGNLCHGSGSHGV